MTAEKILSAKKCGDLFSKADKKAVQQEYRELAKRFHPDICDRPDAEEVFKHLCGLYERAMDLISRGDWEESNVLLLREPVSRSRSSNYLIYRIPYLKAHSFELGAMYVGDRTVTYILESRYASFYKNAIEQIQKLKYSDNRLESEFKRYMPQLDHMFKDSVTGSCCIILQKEPDVYALLDILDYYGGTLPDKHAAWIISRLCNLCCFFQHTRIVHNGLTIGDIFISPKTHAVFPFGGWWYTKREDDKIIGVPKEVYDVMPLSVRTSKKASHKTDLEAVKLIGRNIFKPEETPKAIIDFLNSGGSDAFEEFQKWNLALEKAYGKPHFVNMKVTKSDIYK